MQARKAAEVVDGLEDNEPANAGRGEHIAIEAGERVGAQAVDEKMIAADAVIEHGDVLCGGGLLQARGEHVGPAVVAVGGGGVAVGDGIAKGRR